jgi:hypothetical protein
MGKFELGKLVVTAGVAKKMSENLSFGTFMTTSLERFRNGDWGDLCAEDKEMSDKAVVDGEMIMGAYKHNGLEIWIITEWDRSATTIMFPYER